jgi:hypothetical protein
MSSASWAGISAGATGAFAAAPRRPAAALVAVALPGSAVAVEVVAAAPMTFATAASTAFTAGTSTALATGAIARELPAGSFATFPSFSFPFAVTAGSFFGTGVGAAGGTGFFTGFFATGAAAAAAFFDVGAGAAGSALRTRFLSAGSLRLARALVRDSVAFFTLPVSRFVAPVFRFVVDIASSCSLSRGEGQTRRLSASPPRSSPTLLGSTSEPENT